MQQQMATNPDALEQAVDYVKFKMYRIVQSKDMCEKMYTTAMFRDDQRHNIICSHILCLNAGYNWSDRQAGLLRGVLTTFFLVQGCCTFESET